MTALAQPVVKIIVCARGGQQKVDGQEREKDAHGDAFCQHSWGASNG